MANGKTNVYIKQGVVIDKLRKPITYAIGVIYKIYEKYGLDMYITSGCEGNHGANSLHYVNLAIDIKLPLATYIEFIHNDIIRELGGKGYDIVLHNGSHFHCEFDSHEGEKIYGR